MKRLLAVVFIVLGTTVVLQSPLQAMYEPAMYQIGERYYKDCRKRVPRRVFEAHQQARTAVAVVDAPVAVQVAQGPESAGVCSKASAVAAAIVKGIWNSTWNNSFSIIRYPSRIFVLAVLWQIGNNCLPKI